VSEKVWKMVGKCVETLASWQMVQESVVKGRKRKLRKPVNMTPIYTCSNPLRSVTSRHDQLEQDKPR
jgi:hypothetical protein